MDANRMMKQIEAARAVMDAQMDALNGLSPTVPLLTGATQSAGSMLEASLQAQWVSVGQTLGALVQAECAARAALVSPPAQPQARLADANVVDVVAREVRPD